ncbi:MAG: hypothetical protein ABIL09_10970 [Gemmatimonadota bacterium]
MKEKRIYVASSWRNSHQPRVVDVLRACGHDVYDFRHPEPGNNGFHWSDVDPAWKDWTPAQFRAALDHPIAVSGRRLDFDAMKWADVCVLVLPCGRSAHIEAGWFIGAGKPVLILLEDGGSESELMYGIVADDGGVGYLCANLDEVVDALSKDQVLVNLRGEEP